MPPTAECVIPLQAHCRTCAATIEHRIARIEGVTDARVEHAAGRATLSIDAGVIACSEARIAATRVAAATPHRESHHAHSHGSDKGLWIAAGFWIIGLVLRFSGLSPSLIAGIDLADSFLLVASLIGGWPVLKGAVRSLRKRRLGVNALIAIAAIGAVAIGELFEAASLVVLFGLSEWLEHRAKGRAGRMVEHVLDCAPDTAAVLREGRTHSMPVEAIGVGERILIRPGDRIGMDGIVREGASWVNEAPVTGESQPVSKSSGDGVFAGSLNGEGSLEVEVTRDARQSAIARIGQMVKHALANRPKMQRAVDRFAKVYTPIVVSTSALVVLIPWLMGLPVQPWILRALTFLVVSCPCAFVISLPATIAAALSVGARTGLVIKGGEFIERAAQTKVVAFDKTGTLTTGDLEVDVIPFDNQDEQETLRLAAALEASSEHPVGKAITKLAAEMRFPKVESFRAVPGLGVCGTIAGRKYSLGKPALFSETALRSISDSEEDDRMILLGTNDVILAGFRTRDRVRDETRTVVTDLKRMGIRSVLVTGDRPAAAKACAAMAGIEAVHSDLLPDEKQEVVQGLRTRGAVIMVGDGINDAPSLASADVGVSMGLSAAITADAGGVVLVGDDLLGVPKLVRLARRAMLIARSNMVIAMALKLLVVGLSLGGVASLILAVLVGDVGGTLLVTVNAVRLARSKL